MISFIIDIDHLVDNISEFLFRKELFNCSLVSKQWSIAFNPVLWRRVDTERMKRDSFAAMSRHSHNVRSIIVHYDYVHSIFQPFFPNLRTLKFPISPSIHQRGVSIRTITYFLQSLPSVKRLKLNFDSMAGFYSGFEDLLCALETHPNIDQLDIRFMTKIFGESILRLIQTCRRYKSINVLFGPRTSINDWREMRFDNKAIPQVVQYQDTKLRELTIPLGLFEESEKIVKILGYCPMLERLDISSLSGNDTVKAVCEHLPKCTLLNHLRISNGGRNSEKVIAEVIQSIGRDGGKHGQIRLKSFLAPHCPISEFDGQLLKSLIKLFSGVMTTIEIGDMAPRVEETKSVQRLLYKIVYTR
ncbi:hypothetical protein BGZ76_004448 [Entomortierella beljakovae]|nr:hypothetical protein BGZ76_004448 [Entomortierella beljakovae]